MTVISFEAARRGGALEGAGERIGGVEEGSPGSEERVAGCWSREGFGGGVFILGCRDLVRCVEAELEWSKRLSIAVLLRLHLGGGIWI